MQIYRGNIQNKITKIIIFEERNKFPFIQWYS